MICSSSPTSATKRLEAHSLKGHHAEFWADVEPNLSVLGIENFLSEASMVEAELESSNERSELDRIRRCVERSRLPVVGYQLESRGD